MLRLMPQILVIVLWCQETISPHKTNSEYVLDNILLNSEIVSEFSNARTYRRAWCKRGTQ